MIRLIRSHVAAAAAAAVLAVAGCAGLPPAVPPYPAPFDLSGRVLVSHEGRAFSSGLRWQHGIARDEMWLLTPVGQTLGHIVSDDAGATFTGADRKQFQATSVEALTRQALGWELPLARLQYWVRGEIAPGSAPDTVERDEVKRIVRLEQDGWHIAYVNYPPEEHGGLPRRLDLVRGGQEIRLVVDNWRATSNAP